VYFNKIALIGFLGSDAEARTTKNGASLHGPVTRHQALLEERPG